MNWQYVEESREGKMLLALITENSVQIKLILDDNLMSAMLDTVRNHQCWIGLLW